MVKTLTAVDELPAKQTIYLIKCFMCFEKIYLTAQLFNLHSSLQSFLWSAKEVESFRIFSILAPVFSGPNAS